jgi:MoxR-like ATPase
MQLHPNEPRAAVARAIAALQHNPPAIGLDFDAGEEFERSLNTFTEEDYNSVLAANIERHDNAGVTQSLKAFYNLQCGDVGLVRGGATPVALVRITGNYEFHEFTSPDEPLWFRHRFPVTVMGWYEQDRAQDPEINMTPPAQGTFQILTTENTGTYRGMQRWLQLKEAGMEFAALESAITNFRNLILTGPPGTGKTLLAKRLTAFMLTGRVPTTGEVDDLLEAQRMSLKENQNGGWDIVQFHPSYNYDDFVRGIRIRTNKEKETEYTVEDGPLLRMAKQAEREGKNNDEKKFILIIDEINRANVAAVFGEMIYALEYRGRPVMLQYSDDYATARLPKNLYIIGTMNTADRSIGHIDYAVRRRFAFVPLHPDRDVVRAFHQDAEVQTLALGKFDAVAELFKINEDRRGQTFLSSDYRAEDVQPGHSYFLAQDRDDLKRRMKYQVGPLLREYVADGVLKTEAIQRIEEIERGA